MCKRKQNKSKQCLRQEIIESVRRGKVVETTCARKTQKYGMNYKQMKKREQLNNTKTTHAKNTIQTDTHTYTNKTKQTKNDKVNLVRWLHM